MSITQKRTHLFRWLEQRCPRSIYWPEYSSSVSTSPSVLALKDLEMMITDDSEEDILNFIREIKTNIRKQALAADQMCEDQPVPRNWPEPTD